MRFHQPKKSRIAQLYQMLNAIMQGDKTINAYFTEVNAIYLGGTEELQTYACQCGNCNDEYFQKFVDIEQKDYVYRFFNGLRKDYKMMKSQVLMMKPFPSLDKAYNVAL